MPFVVDLVLIQAARTRHGALLDAQILAQVYIAMTGGQSNLFQETKSNESELTDPFTHQKKTLQIEKKLRLF